ncbi:MAG TPA: hypothetical protein ENG75_06425 [Nitrospirae bacterium]|nr:hypothetical protein BMS3Bbin08_02597 [bacterium BMS3Bbin08]HDH49949.1 hypothetical protein [Nitrospirota bacterium]HDK17558.1 hypothetical protein [Nitrospirota bacterium]HDY70715.1 hypothetical protein [Nitrospirota bacterium]
MKCSLCGLEFKERDGLSSCKGCAVSGSCSLIKCPNCGYEAPKEPGIIKFIRSLKRQKERKK